jgi:hypothetical protein
MGQGREEKTKQHISSLFCYDTKQFNSFTLCMQVTLPAKINHATPKRAPISSL